MTGQEAFDERFGFKVRGEFRVRGWFELPLTAAALILLVVGGFFIFRRMADPYFALGASFGAVPFVLAAWALLCWWLVRIAHTGVTCRYEGDDQEFRITDQHGHTETLYYSDISGVDFRPIRYINRRLRGYVVTVRTKYRSLRYQFIATGHQRINAPEDTPFFVLEQRMPNAENKTEH